MIPPGTVSLLLHGGVFAARLLPDIYRVVVPLQIRMIISAVIAQVSPVLSKYTNSKKPTKLPPPPLTPPPATNQATRTATANTTQHVPKVGEDKKEPKEDGPKQKDLDTEKKPKLDTTLDADDQE